MYTTCHVESAQEVNADILDTIKASFKTKLITINVQESEDDFELTTEIKAVLDERLQEDLETYLTAEASIHQLNNKYGL